MANKRIWWKRGTGLVGAMVLSAVLAGVLLQSPTQALSSVYGSPNPDDMQALAGHNGSPIAGSDDSFLLVLKRESTSVTDNLAMAAYFTTPSPGELINIVDRGTGGHCGVTGTSSEHILVTLDDGVSSVTYKVAHDKICGRAPTTGINDRTTPDKAHFFGSYQVPSTFNLAAHTPDPDTGMYKLNITIKYNTDIHLVPNVNTSLSNGRQQIAFRTELTDCGAVPGCIKYLSTVPVDSKGKGAGTRNYGTLGSNTVAQHFSRQTFKFGLPCSVTAPQIMSVGVYDIDNNTPWGGIPGPYSGRFWIESVDGSGRGTRLAFDRQHVLDLDSTGGTPNPLSSISSSGKTITQTIVAGVTTKATFKLQPYTNYRLVVDNIYTGNLLGIGLPTETIFGDIDCSSTLRPGITADPNTSPIEEGSKISLSATATRSSLNSLNSDYHYEFQTWFDTGDRIYQSGGEDLACSPIAQGNVIDQAGNTAKVVNTCANITVSTSRSGGRATQICGRVVLTRLASDTTTKVDSNPLTKCVAIGKFPHLEARNGDIFAGGRLPSDDPSCTLGTSPDIASSQRLIGGLTYTSYATYGVTALGLSKNFGSMGLSYGTSPTTSADDLVFANTSSTDGYFYNPTGSFIQPTTPRTQHCLNDPFTKFAARPRTASTATSVDISNLPGDTLLTSRSPITLTASSPIPAGKRIIIYAPNADIRLASNITYADRTYASIDQIPRVIILSKRNIVVTGNVTQLDGLYAASDSIYTCDESPTLQVCKAPLRVNGAIVAGNATVPLRTAGADLANPGAMAEIFNLSPDLLIGQLPAPGSPDVYVKTLSETEVPPRF